MNAALLSPIKPADRIARRCKICGTHRPFHKVNENGVPGWNECALHKAAPDLLAALQDAAKVINGMHSKTLPPCFAPTLEMVNAINHAIAKATGAA